MALGRIKCAKMCGRIGITNIDGEQLEEGGQRRIEIQPLIDNRTVRMSSSRVAVKQY